MRNRGILSTVIIVIVVLIAAGVILAIRKSDNTKSQSSSSNSSMTMPKEQSNANTTPSNQNTVTIKDYSFNPAAVTVKVGTTVTWTNEDSIGHTVTADTPSADAPASGTLSKGDTYSFTFNKAGTYTYHCQPHPYMKGTVIVTE